MSTSYAKVINKTFGIPASDGAGVSLRRIIGSPGLKMLDPFLMLDYFESDTPNDYLAGFPSHPHRGFETVTYLLAGKMRHKDNQGHEGVIQPGGVQWMTAGKGIIHSEMPEQENGLLQGFQLWVNLPSYAKMVEPNYQEFSPKEIPIETRGDNTQLKVITGKTSEGTIGPVINNYIQPTMLHIQLKNENAQFIEPMKHLANSFIYVISGALSLDANDSVIGEMNKVKTRELAVLSHAEQLQVTALEKNTQFLLVSAQPINEPIARGGPFVMNTQEEIEQAFSDYRHGLF
ncbi:pirin family protein [Thiomicrorhabdus sp. Kp2]|uniref:pirin family protein n=1 Tax=Thiomicrorhabdus sp. Kp2 TaxID=1123518 RepID=UPI000419788B|nr:pirin family protein [Thiomicrorhabdus sp. Kp2]